MVNWIQKHKQKGKKMKGSKLRKMIVRGSYGVVEVVRGKNKTVGNLIAPALFTAARALDGEAYCLYHRAYGPATELAMCNRAPGIRPAICCACKINRDQIAEEMGV